MKTGNDDLEYMEIVSEILKNREFNKLIRNHPKIASTNAKKHFNLNKKEINIIESHMFPLVVKIKPKYKESYVVAFADKLVWGYEKFIRYCKEISFELGKSYIYLSRDI